MIEFSERRRELDHYKYPYLNRRFSVYAKRGMIDTTHPVATEAGIDVQEQGGRAMASAMATAAALTVVAPTSNGIGGEAFRSAWMNRRWHGITPSGRSAKRLLVGGSRSSGCDSMPEYGWLPVTMP